MDWINVISNNDNRIVMITFEQDDVLLHIELWDGKKMYLRFINYMAMKEKQCIGNNIGDVIIGENSLFLRELQCDIINGGGSIEEIKEKKSFVFMDEWNERIVLEVLSQSVICGFED